MKVLTILGTRPEIIRLSLIIGKLDRLSEHTLLHTGQNYTPELDSIFFERLKIREPDIRLDTRSETAFGQIAKILEAAERVISEVQPDACLILGDTNSGLSAIVAARMGVPVFHMEAGNRCFDLRVPEERNRKIIDHVSTLLMPYVENSKVNLLNEGISKEAIFVTGNPIFEVIQNYQGSIEASDILERLGLEKQKFFLVTAHRAENVDVPSRLAGIVEALNTLASLYQYPIIWSFHPRTQSKMDALGLEVHPLVRRLPPFDFFEFIKLEQQAFCVITDSGTVQEEACIFGIPSITIRDTTERPETVECGSNILTGCIPNYIIEGVKLATETRFSWRVPDGYLDANVSDKVLRLILSNT
ncbi:UDP-N-acetylglucosamine 2-epimerase (non-hydrolyzing) [Ancylothrix sp. C2]|uniref:non-hydrolyzing UDP-N-acetylglucosamine 2-epimerase n=1 Tax=Ancylothrix sp. D3o TaxID=2953691 RepID=UPI0021BA8242|nr:UDP-N-acetylglucosamine 2-epimerase (non-hydrolyzing) [Ancylothrix sp. D3o]MCT7950030.1 UDP-N-acetylglucosamine 2-epimerase (non-hydrolyzing) [Ancylothrix sp. D3o]